VDDVGIAGNALRPKSLTSDTNGNLYALDFVDGNTGDFEHGCIARSTLRRPEAKVGFYLSPPFMAYLVGHCRMKTYMLDRSSMAR
jgi:hypothetical protein